MTKEVLHAPSGTYELLNSFYKRKLMRTSPSSPWYGKIAGIAPGTEIVRIIKNPVEGAISLSINKRMAGLASLTHQAIINSDDTIASLAVFPDTLSELGVFHYQYQSLFLYWRPLIAIKY